MNSRQKKVLSDLELLYSNAHIYGGYDSSALLLENGLKARGIMPAHKLYYKYKFPNGVTAPDYEKRIDMYSLYFLYQPGTIAECIKQGIIKENLSDAEIAEIERHIKKFEITSKVILSTNVEYLRQLNPELRKIKTEDVWAESCLVRGATYGIAPNDIKYFIESDRSKRKADLKRARDLEQVVGVKVGYILSPDTCAEVLKAAKENHNTGVRR
ncbi:MAG: hypothetical protein J6W40_02935 [Alphaproteobacteria bacterium]|nr:hypothetical protein [Alphaproteobacteria bacterium]